MSVIPKPRWQDQWDHCYEDMSSDPCGRTPEGARWEPEGGWYPVCARHFRGNYDDDGLAVRPVLKADA